MCTLRQQYMKDIVADAQSKRYKIAPDDPKKQGIIISSSWMKELMEHPYYSSKSLCLTGVEKPGTGIFLMKEHAKLYKVRTSTTKHSLSKRLSSESSVQQEEEKNDGGSSKRKNLGGGKYVEVPVQKPSQQESMDTR